MNTLLFFIILSVGSFLAVLLAIVSHKKRIKKIQKIDEQCLEIIYLANKISKKQKSHDLYLEDVLCLYRKHANEVRPFGIDSTFLKSDYLMVLMSDNSGERLSKQASLCYLNLSNKNKSSKRGTRINSQREYLAVI